MRRLLIVGVAAVLSALSCFGAADATVYAWRGEKRVVWRDQTNRTAEAVLVRPTCEQAFVRVGVARPVRGDNDILYADRAEWGGAALVGTGKTTSVYVAGGNPCTGIAQPLVDCEWLGAYPGAVDLDGFLRWAYCSWPANPNGDSTYDPWFGHWSAGGTFLAYPSGPSLRCLALFNGLNLSEKLKILRDEGKIDDALAAALRAFEYKGAKAYETYPAHDVLRRTEALVHVLSSCGAK